MKTALYIFRRDLLRLLKNPIALIVMIGVCILPSLYAWFNIAANIDPYANTKNVKVAVANEDVGATLEDQTLNVGKEVIEKVKANDKLGWVFCSEEEALEKVCSGEVYASIVIPENFSEEFISFSKGELESPQINYYVNQKKNAIAPKITDTGASTIQEQINSTFSGIVADVISQVIDQTAGALQTAIDQTEKSVTDYLSEIMSNLRDFETLLTDMNSDIETTKNALTTTKSNLDRVTSAIDDCRTVVDTVTSDLKNIRDTFSSVSATATQLISSESLKLENAYSEVNTALTNVETVAQSAKSILSSALGIHKDLLEIEEQQLTNFKSFLDLLPDGTLKDLLQEKIASTRERIASEKADLDSLQAELDKAENLITTIQGLRTSTHDQIKAGIDALQKYQTDTFFPSVNTALDKLTSVSGQLSGLLEGIKPSVSSLKTLVGQLGDTLSTAETAFDNTKSSLSAVSDKLSSISAELGEIQTSELYSKLQDLKTLDTDKIAEFMSEPVQIETEVAYQVENYGSAMTPFFTNLAIWVGGLVLTSILKSEVDREKLKKATERQKFFGRLFLFVFLAIVQAVIVCIGDYALIGAQCLHHGTFILSGIFCAVAYTTFIYAMALAFKHIGKALCVVLVIIQIPGSAGTYPIEMTAGFFQAVHPFLPFTYGVNAMRECIAGYYSAYLVNNWLALAILFVVGLIIGLGIRPLIVNMNRMFDRKLEMTDLIACEEADEDNENKIEQTIGDVIRRNKTGHAAAVKFEKKYRLRVRAGFLSILVSGAVFLWLMFSVNSKVIFLTLWIITLVFICLYLLTVEYAHTRISYTLEESSDFADESAETGREEK